jgi:rod shape determining protein RodA
VNITSFFLQNKIDTNTESSKFDWWIFLLTIPLLLAGLATMHSFSHDNSFAYHQIIVITISLLFFFGIGYFLDTKILRSTRVSVILFSVIVVLLGSLSVLGTISHGAKSWYDLGFLSFQPSDFAKVALIIILAKYFSRRHIEIANLKHIIVSGLYAFAFFFLVLLHPDLGSAMIIGLIWLGMIMVSGVSKKHLLGMIVLALIAFVLLWSFAFKEYQKDRIRNFIDPLSDIRGSGYNAYQSTIAVGSGYFVGKGLGYGTQSRLNFLPEYQTDFIFAAFAEEWGFVGVIIFFIVYGSVVIRIIYLATKGSSNFEILFGAGVAIYFIVHLLINVGMNIQLLPVTGTPLPFMSYGGSHMLSEYVLLGILVAMKRHSRTMHRDMAKNEFIGPQ